MIEVTKAVATRRATPALSSFFFLGLASFLPWARAGWLHVLEFTLCTLAAPALEEELAHGSLLRCGGLGRRWLRLLSLRLLLFFFHALKV